MSRLWWKEWVKSRIVGLCSTAIVGGRPHIDYVVKLGLAREGIFRGYDVIDNDYFETRADSIRLQRNRFRAEFDLPERFILASSRFIEKKNLFRLIDAYAGYVARKSIDPWSLIIIGDGPLRSALETYIVDAGLSKFVRLPGFKQYDELPVYYALGSVFVHASTSEQWGLVVNEAMAAGLPVMVSERCGCALDLVENGRNGYTFDPYDAEALARLMLHVSSDDCDREAMGWASREIIGRWTPETFSAGLTKAVEHAMAAPRPRANLLDKSILWALAPK